MKALSVSWGRLASFVVGYASIEFLMRFLRTHSTLPFIIYRIALGALLLVLIVLAALIVIPLIVLAGLFVWLKVTEEQDEDILELDREGA